jgi:hypothetical protein
MTKGSNYTFTYAYLSVTYLSTYAYLLVTYLFSIYIWSLVFYLTSGFSNNYTPRNEVVGGYTGFNMSVRL